MRVRPSTILLFALLSAPVLNAAGETTASTRNLSRNRAHPAAEKTVKSTSKKAKAVPAKTAHAPEHATALRSSSRSASSRAPERPARETAKTDSVRSVRGGRVIAVKADRETRSEREYDRRHPVAETKEVKGHKVAESKAAHVEPERVARLTPAPIVRNEPEESAPVSTEIESDPEAANVVHDRKVHHHSVDDADDNDEPRKATPSDFMSEPATKPAESAPVSPATAKVGAASVIRSKAALSVAPKNIPAAIAKATAEPEPPPVLVSMVYRHGRLVVPAALKGSHEILLHQNEMADSEGLERIRDDADLDDMRENKLLVAIPAVQGLQVDERLPMNRRYTRPWTAQFLSALARAHYQRFHTALQVNSAVRTVEFQHRLLLTNGNAAPAEGETASPHLTGQAVDLAKHGLSMTEIAWLRGYLLPLVQQGKVDVEEEFQQACFHVSVYKKYMPQSAPRREIAGGPHRSGITALAAAVR